MQRILMITNQSKIIYYDVCKNMLIIIIGAANINAAPIGHQLMATYIQMLILSKHNNNTTNFPVFKAISNSYNIDTRALAHLLHEGYK